MSTEIVKQKPPTVVNGVVQFTALLGGRLNQTFEVSCDALVEHFGAASRAEEDLLEAFRRGKTEILAAAAQSANTPVNDVVTLGTGDFAGEKGDAAPR